MSKVTYSSSENTTKLPTRSKRGWGAGRAAQWSIILYTEGMWVQFPAEYMAGFQFDSQSGQVQEAAD